MKVVLILLPERHNSNQALLFYRGHLRIRLLIKTILQRGVKHLETPPALAVQAKNISSAMARSRSPEGV